MSEGLKPPERFTNTRSITGVEYPPMPRPPEGLQNPDYRAAVKKYVSEELQELLTGEYGYTQKDFDVTPIYNALMAGTFTLEPGPLGIAIEDRFARACSALNMTRDEMEALEKEFYSR